MVKARACLCALALTSSPAVATEGRLAWVVEMDVSSSQDNAEGILQQGGLAPARIAPEVEAAMFAFPLPVATAVYEWSGRNKQQLLVDWTLLTTRPDLLLVAETIPRSKRSHNAFPTAMVYALGYGAGLFDWGSTLVSFVLNMAGDGESNEGFTLSSAYAKFPFAGRTVNGLGVQTSDYSVEISLVEYLQKNNLHGPRAFLEIARGFEDDERAMTRKLEREMTPRAVSALNQSLPQTPA